MNGGALETVLTVNETKELTLTCRVNANPMATVYWIIPLHLNSSASIAENVSVIENPNTNIVVSRLIINNVSRSHAGIYECYGNNSLGVVRRTSFVYVQCKLRNSSNLLNTFP